MVCPGCGEKNRDGARFCTYCGTTLALRCPVCDTEVVPGGRFCDSCGASVDPSVQAAPAAAAPASAARKVVTVLFCDLTGSTALEERMDAESVRSILDRFYAAMRSEIERFGGRVVKFTGDGAMAAFGVPDVHEDDADRAVDAALAMRTELEELASDLQLDLSLKIGINTGEVVVSESDDDVVGDAVNVASRLEGAATAGEILVGEDTWRLTRSTSRYEPVEPLTLKGKSEPVPAYKLLSVDERTADSAAAPFVGRDVELGRLLAVFQDAVDANAARLVTIIGAPGLGKTRLARELMSELSEQARVRETRCDPAGESTLAPIADLMRSAAGISETDTEDEVIAALASRIPEDDPDRERIAARAGAILGVGLPGSTEETFWALRRLIEAAATVQPVVLVLDDIHWAEPLLLDLIEHLAEWIKDAPVLLVGTARPELRDLRPSLVEGGRAASVVALEGLDQAATAQLALNLLGAEEEGLPSELLAKIPASTEGNPLFVRELVRMLVDDGVLVRTADGWNVTVDVEAIQVPPTITSLLSARVDRLRSDERTVVELASVVGKEFFRGALYDLAPPGVKDLVDGCLESLRRKELVEPVGTYWIDEPVYRFHHVLIRDAAYRRVLKETRADVHERVAEWLERKTADVLGEHDELVGYHLEQAHEYKQQLGRPDDDLGRRAAGLLGTAAQRALDRDDLPAAAALSGRALDRLPLGDGARAELLIIRCEALLSMIDVQRAAPAVDELVAIADTPRLRAWATCFSGHLASIVTFERVDEIEQLVAAAATDLTGLGDHAGAAKAHGVRAQTLAVRLRLAEAEAALDEALTAARAANDRRRITATLRMAPHAALWGPSPVSRAGGRCLDIVRLLRITTGSAAVEATSLRCQAVLEALRGRVDAARRMLSSARRTLTELGLEGELLDLEQYAAVIELVDGDPVAAAEHLRTSYEGFLRMGVDVLAAQSAAMLAGAHLKLGEDAEAAALIDVVEGLGSRDLKAQIETLTVKAELLARRGEFAEARELAQHAVELAEPTDALFDHGMACRSLASVLRAAGDADGARRAEDRARALFERKGATALIEAVAPSENVATEAPQSAADVLTNRCVEVIQRRNDFVSRGDVDSAMSMYADDCLDQDRRRGLHLVKDGKEAIRRNIEEVALGGNRVTSTPVATRGERLALLATNWQIEPSGYEVDHLTVAELDENDQISRIYGFDIDDRAGAFAELEERFLAIEPAPARAAGSSIEWNRSALQVRDSVDRVNAGDAEGAAALNSDELYSDDRRTGLRLTLTGAQHAENIKVAAAGGEVDLELVATRGDRLALMSVLWRYPRRDFEVESLFLNEIDGGGRSVTVIQFDPSDVEAAFTELDARFMAGEGAPHTGLVMPMANLARTFSQQDWEGVREVFAEEGVVHDHRPASLGEIRGSEAWIESAKALTELVRYRADVVAYHRLRDGTGACQMLYSGVTPEGAPVESHFQFVFQVRGNRLVRMEPFPVDELDAALARFDELTGTVNEAFDTACTRATKRCFGELFPARAWSELEAAVAPDFFFEDHRPGLRNVYRGSGGFIENSRILADQGTARIDLVPIAVRGDRLSLNVWTAGGRGGPGGLETEILAVVELDGEGRLAAVVTFERNDLDAAIAELDERFVAGEGAAHAEIVRPWSGFQRDYNSREWDALRERLMPDFVAIDHRPASLGRLEGVDAYLRAMQMLIELVPGRSGYIESFPALGDRAGLVTFQMSGATADGFQTTETMHNLVTFIDGRMAVSELYPAERLDDALARFDELTSERSQELENRATRLIRRTLEARKRGEWSAFAALVAADSHVDDKRQGFQASFVGRDEVLAQAQATASVGAVDIDCTVIATRGQRLCVDRRLYNGPPGSDFEVETLNVCEIDDEGRFLSAVVFDADALDDAFAELDGRFAAGEGASAAEGIRLGSQLSRAITSADYTALRALLTDDFVLVDHRRASLGEMRPDDWVSSIRALVDLSETYRVEMVSYPRFSRHACLYDVRGRGKTRHGGEFETAFYAVIQTKAGRFVRQDLFPSDGLADAIACFEEFTAAQRPLENAATRGIGRWRTAFLDRNWDAVADLHSEDVQLVDTRMGLRSHVVGRDGVVANYKAMAEVGADLIDIETRAIRGDRLAVLWMRVGGVARAGFYTESLLVIETDESDTLIAAVIYAPDALDDAMAELNERYLAAEGRDYADLVRLGQRLLEGIRAGDWEGLARLLTDDFVMLDHRTASFGEIRGRDAWIEFMRPWGDLAASSENYFVAYHALGADGGIGQVVDLVVTEHGSDVEFAYYTLGLVRDGKLSRIELFADDELDAALARLEELRAERVQSLDNEALRAMRGSLDALVTSDWGAYDRLYVPEAVMDDCRSGLRNVIEGRDAIVTAGRELIALGADVYELTAIATRGDRLAMARVTHKGTGGPFESEIIKIVELDDDGRICANVNFDPDDADEAFAELDRRALASFALPFVAQGIDLSEAYNTRDWARLRSVLTDDFFVEDHRPASLGRIDGPDEWIDALRPLTELIPDSRWRVTQVHATDANGALCSLETGGTTADGATVDLTSVGVVRFRDGLLASNEIFPIDQFDRALERYRDLARTIVLPTSGDLTNASTRAGARLVDAFGRRDWDAVADCFSVDAINDDRRSVLRDYLDGRDAIVEGLRQLAGVGALGLENRVVATRGSRLALSRRRMIVAPARDIEAEILVVEEADADGRIRLGVLFDPDDIEQAIDELDERFIAGEGSPHAGFVRSVMATRHAWNNGNWNAETLSDEVSESVELVDHRAMGIGGLQGRDAWIAYTEGLQQASGGLRVTFPAFEVLAKNAVLVRLRLSGTNADGGDVEIEHLVLGTASDGRRLERLEYFAIDDLDAALARFEELGSHEPARHLENAAFRTMQRWREALERGDLDALTELHTEDSIVDDRRRGLRSFAEDRDACIANLRAMIEIGTIGADIEPLAVRGDRLILQKCTFRGAEKRGTTFGSELLVVNEIAADGRHCAGVCFDVDDLEGAFAELQDRFIEGEGRPYADLLRVQHELGAAANRRDWDAARAVLADDLIRVDHRPVSLGETTGHEWIEAHRALVELVPSNLGFTSYYRGLEADRCWAQVLLGGSNTDGGDIEFSFQSVVQVRDGKFVVWEVFPDSVTEEARVLFERLGRASLAHVLENACVRVVNENQDRNARGDIEGATALYSSDCELDDRRAGIHTFVHGREAMAANMWGWIQVGFARYERETIATRGDSLAVERWRVEDRTGLVSEGLGLYELDDEGLMRRVVFADDGDLGLILDELDERFIATEGAGYAEPVRTFASMSRAFNLRRIDEFRSLFADDAVIRDHRTASLGEPSADERAEAARALIDVVPTIRSTPVLFHGLTADRFWAQLVLQGENQEGGDVEFSYQSVGKVDRGRIVHLEFFPDEMQDSARALFEELDAQGMRAHWAPENAASRAGQRLTAAWIGQDWDTTASLYAPDIQIRELRTGLRFESDGRDAAVEYMRSAATITRAGFFITRLAVAGERLALVRLTIGDEAQDRWTSEVLVLYSLNEDGLFDFAATFDSDDLDTAFEMLIARFLEGEGRAHRQLLEMLRRGLDAYRRRDWDAYLAALDDSFVQIDHRPVSAGTVQGLDAHLTWIRSLTDLADDARIRPVEIVRLADDRGLGRALVTGTTSDGMSVEVPFLMLFTVRDGRIALFEQFAVEDHDAAIARFEELGRTEAMPVAVPENFAFRSVRRGQAIAMQGDWDALSDRFADDVYTVDRRSGLGSRVEGKEAVLAHVRAVFEGGTELSTELIATRGEWLDLSRESYSVNDFTVEAFRVSEVDENGRTRVIVIFDLDDLDGAFGELNERFIAGEAAPYERMARSIFAVADTHRERDWERWRDSYSGDIEVIDHRPAGWGVIRGIDAWTEHTRAVIDVMPDARLWFLTTEALDTHGGVGRVLMTGTNSTGGEVELSYFALMARDVNWTSRLEVFPLEQRDAVMARFEELRPDIWSKLENTASRDAAVAIDAVRTGDWDSVRAVLAEDLIIHDRRRGVGSRGHGIEAWVNNFRTFRGLGFRPIENRVVAIRGDRMVLSYEAATDSDGNVVDALTLTETDEHGRAKAILFFDADALDEAFAELDDRFLASDECDRATRVALPFFRAYNQRDWGCVRDILTEDFCYVDHNPASVGAISDVDELTTYWEQLIAMVPDIRLYTIRLLATSDRCVLGASHSRGTDEFGNAILREHIGVIQADGDLLSRIEIFPSEQMDAASARFEELRQGDRLPLENLVTRQSLIFRDAMFSGDWEPVRTAFAEDIVADDRRRGIGSRSVGLDAFINNFRTMRELGFRSGYYTVLATRGDHLELRLGTATDADGNVMEALILSEANEAGLIAAQLYFDTDALDEATRELEARYLEGEGARFAATWRAAAEFLEAHNARDWAAIEAQARPGFVAVNHRPASWGTIDDPAEFIRTIRALTEVAPDVRQSAVQIHAIAEGIVAFELCARGPTPDGAEVEIVNHVVTQSRDGYATRTEMFPEDQLDAALQRFDELRAEQDERGEISSTN